MTYKCVSCEKTYSYKSDLLRLHYHESPSHAPDDWTTCPECGKVYEILGRHWSNNSECNHPNFSDHQREIISGVLMGDGTINRGNRNPRLQVEMTSLNYLRHLEGKFGILGGEVVKSRTAEECAKQNRERGFSPNAQAENYSDKYVWYSVGHPELSEFSDWYSTGEKVFPPNIELTPTTLKHWYVCDGCWKNYGTNRHMTIAMSNESENTGKIDQIFKNAGLPEPSNYANREFNCEAQFTVGQSKVLLEYMGEPLPDFEYKWPNETLK